MSSPSTRRTFADFKAELAKSETLDARLEATRKLHQQLLPNPADALAFGQDLWNAINTHEQGDTLDQAHKEGRAIYRSWHAPGAVDTVEVSGSDVKIHPRLGIDALNVSLDPAAFRQHKNAYKADTATQGVMVEVPATLIHPGQKSFPVFDSRNGTMTALLPEEHYAALFAFNEAAKAQKRQHKGPFGTPADQRPANPALDLLTAHAKMMRASVTRPVLFDAEDIGSFTHALPDDNPARPPHIRKGSAEDPRLNTGFDEKMAESHRRQAVFYQSFIQTVPARKKKETDAWNEMVVKFRASGHTAPLDKALTVTVPAFRGRATLDVAPYASKGNVDRSSTQVIAPIKPPAGGKK